MLGLKRPKIIFKRVLFPAPDFPKIDIKLFDNIFIFKLLKISLSLKLKLIFNLISIFSL